MSAQYLQPGSGEELRADLGMLTKHSVVLAGGTDIFPKLRERRPQVDIYLNLCKVKELHGIHLDGDQLRIGAMTTHAQAAENELIRQYFPALHQACAHVGSQQIRNKGTLGGSLVNASPAGDIMPCIYLFCGMLELISANGRRNVPIHDFLIRPAQTILGQDEILSALLLPIKVGRLSCFYKLGSRKEVTIAQISLCVAWHLSDGRRKIEDVWLCAVDEKPIFMEDPQQMVEDPEAFSDRLSGRIRAIRLERKRESKLKMTQAEKLYKERAVKGVVFDCLNRMEQTESMVSEMTKRCELFEVK